MWRPLFRRECLKAGDRLRKELLVGGDCLWTEYEVMEAGKQRVLLRPLISNGHAYADNPAHYKKIDYEVLRSGSSRIWVSMEKPGF